MPIRQNSLIASCLCCWKKDLIGKVSDTNVHNFRTKITIWEKHMSKFKGDSKISFRKLKKKNQREREKDEKIYLLAATN